MVTTDRTEATTLSTRSDAVSDRLADEIRSFGNLWPGGYFEGDPLDPRSASSYPFEMSFVSILHVTYLVCIKPYVTPETVALEIGPGRGAWSKAILSRNPRELVCLDALPAEHNGFWTYVGRDERVKYIQVSDFECADLPENKFNFVFSFGCLCHISPEGVEAYFRNLHGKLRSGANAFVMIADYGKYNKAIREAGESNFLRDLFRARRYWPIRAQLELLKGLFDPAQKSTSESPAAMPGRWYHLGIDRACEMLEKHGYEVVCTDLEVNFRDPVIHFRKP